LLDTVVHGWDIAIDARKDYGIDEAAAALALRVGTILVDLDDGLHHAPATAAERNAPPSQKLLSATGRRPLVL
jgi:hypothetical protein